VGEEAVTADDVVLIPKPEHGSLEWHKLRHRRNGQVVFGASEAPALMGAGRYVDQTLAGLCIRKLPDEPEVGKSTEAMDRGHALEPALVSWAQGVLGTKLHVPAVMYARGRFVVSLDAIADDGSLIVEAKSTTDYFDPDDFRQDWYWQACGQAAGTGIYTVAFAVLDGALRLHIHVIDINPDDVATLELIAEEVGACLDEGVMPEHIQPNTSEQRLLHPVSKPKQTIEADAELADSLDDLRRLKADAKALEDETDRIAAWCMGQIGSAEVVVRNGVKLATWGTTRRKTTDWNALMEHYGITDDDLQKFSKPLVYRTFRTPDPKPYKAPKDSA
jgi:hypothetical protein